MGLYTNTDTYKIYICGRLTDLNENTGWDENLMGKTIKKKLGIGEGK